MTAGRSELDNSGRTALVTGAGAGIGVELARALARSGATVWVNDVDPDRVATTVATLAGEGLAVAPAVCDITDHAAVQDLCAETGWIDILVNNAGTGAQAVRDGRVQMLDFVDTTPDQWDPFLQVNVMGVLNVSHAYLPGMLERGWGRILTIVSDSARRGERKSVVYGAAKAAATGFTRGLAAEVGRRGVTVNALALGTILHTGPPADPEMLARLVRPYPVGRLGTPADVGPIAVLLCSDAGSWITGQVYPVDGGYAPAL